MITRTSVLIASVAGLSSGGAVAGVTVLQGDGAPTYSTTLTFDEPGGPVGVGLPATSWSSLGVTSLQAGDGFNRVLNLHDTPGFGWLPDSNMFVGGFGVFMNFENDLTSFSAQVWDNAGPAGPFSGGMFVVALDDGVEVLSVLIDLPVFGPGTDGTWFDIVATGADVFDEVRFVGFTNAGPQTLMDNASWNVVPSPGVMVMFAAGGLGGVRGRRG